MVTAACTAAQLTRVARAWQGKKRIISLYYVVIYVRAHSAQQQRHGNVEQARRSAGLSKAACTHILRIHPHTQAQNLLLTLTMTHGPICRCFFSMYDVNFTLAANDEESGSWPRRTCSALPARGRTQCISSGSARRSACDFWPHGCVYGIVSCVGDKGERGEQREISGHLWWDHNNVSCNSFIFPLPLTTSSNRR